MGIAASAVILAMLNTIANITKTEIIEVLFLVDNTVYTPKDICYMSGPRMYARISFCAALLTDKLCKAEFSIQIFVINDSHLQ